MTNKDNFLKHYFKSIFIYRLSEFIKKSFKTKIQVLGLSGTLQSIFFAALYKKTALSFIFIAQNKKEAYCIFSDLREIFSEEQLFFYPNFFYKSYNIKEIDNNNILFRSKVFQKLMESNSSIFIITFPDAIFEKVITFYSFRNRIFTLNIGQELSIEFINKWLFNYGFYPIDFVTSPGQFSIRGNILDIFSFSSTKPFRIEFFNKKINSLRNFEIKTQKSLNNFQTINILPSLTFKLSKEKCTSFFNIIPNNTFIFLKNGPLTIESIDSIVNKYHNIHDNFIEKSNKFSFKDLFITKKEFIQKLKFFNVIEGIEKTLFKPKKSFFLKSYIQPSFNKNFNYLIENLKNYTQKGYTNYLSCTNEYQVKRFHEIFHNIKDKKISFFPFIGNFYSGFIDETHKILCYTDHEIFNRFYISFLNKEENIEKIFTIKSLSNLDIGDYVTHIDHGIGRFLGLVNINLHGKNQETLKIIYKNNDILYVSIHSLHKISKFRGKDGIKPNLNKLGSSDWKQLKNKTKIKVKKLAFNLIQLYAKREISTGFSFSTDNYLQNKFESYFPYEETPDQLQAIQEVKNDMENNRPMDRLICGDVGFGKTEIAMRAAFKAIINKKQVVLLVPTTILAFHHYKNFKDRFKNFSVCIDYLSRFRSLSDKKKIFDDLKNGKINLIIGTHQLINKKINFKDLGLIIIDEEHKFGVEVKDQLKILKNQVDILTLTATPIPRTLQFSLMEFRDLSVINTFPINRLPINTRIIQFDLKFIKDSINYEISRGGQVFFIHNKISDLYKLYTQLQNLLPNIRISIGHGKMKGKILESLMIDFIEKKIDLLLSTSIIESGLDIPNVNTIFIYQAQNFGLADLHQMRGRVGRSNIQSFCYLIIPSLTYLNDESIKRLQAIEMFSDLGSGFKIAMKDLEIRGAGNLLGGEQSGFISEIGFEVYQKILNEAIQELKNNEPKLFYKQNKNFKKKNIFISDVKIETDMELFFPSNYINSTTERLKLYQKLSLIKEKVTLDKFQEQLQDRFGPLPIPTKELLHSVYLKCLCIFLGFEKVILKKELMFLYFINNSKSIYYKSKCFYFILNYIQKYPKEISLKQNNKKKYIELFLRIEKVKTILQAISWIEKLKNSFINLRKYT